MERTQEYREQMTATDHMFDNVVVPGSGGSLEPSDLSAEIAGWANSEALRALLEHFSAPAMPDGLAAKLAALEEFTAQAWDFRRGADGRTLDRNQVNPGVIDDPATEHLVRAAATTLGLAQARPPSRRIRLHRDPRRSRAGERVGEASYAAYLLEKGVVTAAKVVASSRLTCLWRRTRTTCNWACRDPPGGGRD